jgi:hypothetical protein
MKKASQQSSDGLRPEYDLRSLGLGVRRKYAERQGTTLVALQPEVAQAFPTSEAVNRPLRAVLKAPAIRLRSGRARKRPPSRSKTSYVERQRLAGEQGVEPDEPAGQTKEPVRCLPPTDMRWEAEASV